MLDGLGPEDFDEFLSDGRPRGGGKAKKGRAKNVWPPGFAASAEGTEEDDAERVRRQRRFDSPPLGGDAGADQDEGSQALEAPEASAWRPARSPLLDEIERELGRLDLDESCPGCDVFRTDTGSIAYEVIDLSRSLFFFPNPIL